MLRSAIKNLFVIVVSCVLMVVWSLCLLWTGKEVRGMESAELQKTESQQDQGLAHDQPQISFDSTHYDAGEVREGTEVSHTYRVKNTGASTLNIKGVSVG